MNERVRQLDQAKNSRPGRMADRARLGKFAQDIVPGRDEEACRTVGR